MHRIAISILNHGEADSTLACVESLLAEAGLSDGRYHLVIRVADNGSAPSDQQDLQTALSRLPEVAFSLHDRNLGFAAGHNRNVEALLAGQRPDFVWLLNNDCVVQPGTVNALLDCARSNPKVGIWGSTLLESDVRTIQCAGGCFYNCWLSSYRQYGQGKPVTQRSQLKAPRFSYISGASLFMPIATLDSGLGSPRQLHPKRENADVQLLNESFFLYFEELDLVRRLDPSLTIDWCRDALITHTGGKSAGTDGSRRSAQAEYHSTLSALKFTRLYFPGTLLFMAPARYVAKSLQLLFTGNLRMLGNLNAAYADFWKWLRTAQSPDPTKG